ncbi:RDD family protein [Geoalkalibacter subterraneus]|uniref:RDD family protein n=1 Tax=Geoalkalibacter subterraneus TaxID=483547 RepID=UPI0009FEDCDC|nr:RDD family protein [Geoalkalibacter subterraneus]
MSHSALRYAGFWARVQATMIDSLLFALILMSTAFLVYGKQGFLHLVMQGHAGWSGFFLNWVIPAALTLVFWSTLQATPGKMMFKMKIVDAQTGCVPSFSQLLIRYLGYIVATIPLGLGLLWVGFDSRKQGWHDKLAKTVVVQPQHPSAIFEENIFDPPLNQPPSLSEFDNKNTQRKRMPNI